MASIKSSFFVRKSSRTSGRNRTDKAGKDTENTQTSSPREIQSELPIARLAPRVKSSEKAISFVRALKNVFHLNDRHSSETTSAELPSGVDYTCPLNSSACDPSTVVNPTFSVDSCSSIDVSPLSRSPTVASLRIDDLESSNENRRTCRRMLSPNKRKSDEENENAGCSPSPSKSSRSSSSNKSPSKSKSLPLVEELETPKSSRRLNKRLPRAATSTPRRLFGSPEKRGNDSCDSVHDHPSCSSVNNLSSPIRSPKALHKPDARAYQSTKRCLHTSKPDRLIGREREERELEEFICYRLDRKTSGSLYISGAPGTGKTAVVNHIIDKLKSEYQTVQTAYINCMTLKDSGAVFCTLHQQLVGKPLRSKDATKVMEKLFTTTSENIILVLDEVDQLDSKHQDVLYRIFEWPALENAKLILIGIANALDLTDRLLPRLQASTTCRPTLMNFTPYTSVQITDILKCRLERDAVVEPSAISFCAKKVSAVAGDMRKALDVCRRAVELVESDVRSQLVLKPSDCNSPKKNQDAPIKKVTINHISMVMSDIYGSSVSSANTSENDIPLQQKLTVCSLLLLVKNGKGKEVLLGKLHEVYRKVCRRQQLASVEQSEFHSLCSLLESRGVVVLKRAKETRLIKVSLKLDENELEQTLKDKTLMAAVIKDGLPQ